MTLRPLYLLIALAPLLLQAQQVREIAHWNFENDWRKPVSGTTLFSGGPKMTSYRENGTEGAYMRFDQTSADRIAASVTVPGAVTVQFWLRYPAFDFNPECRWVMFSDYSLFFSMRKDGFQFSTNCRTASGKQAQDDFIILFNGKDRANIGYYLDHQWHHYTLRYDPASGKKELFVDGICPEGFSKTVAEKGDLCLGGQCKKEFYMGYSPTVDWALLADVDEVRIYEGMAAPAIKATSVRAVPERTTTAGKAAGIDLREFAPGHPNVSLMPIEQLQQFPLPRYAPDHQLIPLFNWIGMDYLGGIKLQGVSRTQAIANMVSLQEEMCRNWHYSLLVHNTATSRPAPGGPDPNEVLGASIILANKHPEWPLAVTSFWLQLHPDDKGKPGAPHVYRETLPNEYYLRDASGKYLTYAGATQARPAIISPSAPDALFRADGKMQRTQISYILAQLTRPINYLCENGEEPPVPVNPEVLKKSSLVATHKNQSGKSDWTEYQAWQKLRFRNAYKEEFLSLPALKHTIFTWYGIDAGPLDRYDWKVMRQVNSPINGQYYSTPDFYPRTPDNWRMWTGAWRGWEWIRVSREKEIAAGDRLFSPFVAAGWSLNEADNVRPSQWLGLLKCLGPAGAEFYYTGFFNEGDGTTPFPDPRNYVWQAAIPAYAQAITSRYEDLLRRGNVTRDSTGKSLVSLWAGDPRILLTLRKQDDMRRYVIAGNVNPTSNAKGDVPDSLLARIRLDGQVLSFWVRRQGSVYIYDRSDAAKPVFYQLDSWHEPGHPLAWSQDFAFEGEVPDKSSQTMIATERPAMIAEGDFSAFSSYLRAAKPAASAEYHFTPRSEGSYTFRVRARAQGKSAAAAFSLDGQALGNLKISSHEWQWYEIKADKKGKKTAIRTLSSDLHQLKITFADPYLDIDRMRIIRR